METNLFLSQLNLVHHSVNPVLRESFLSDLGERLVNDFFHLLIIHRIRIRGRFSITGRIISRELNDKVMQQKVIETHEM